MKKINKLCGVVIFIPVFLLCSCGLCAGLSYSCNVDEVDTVQIVQLDKYVEGEYRFEYSVLCEITDKAAFIDRLNDIDYSINWGDPYVIEVGYIVIKVNYLNGDFDLVYSNSQWLHRSGKNNSGYVCFDKGNFDTLLSEYLEE